MRVKPPIVTPTKDHGITEVEILTGVIPCARYEEILLWLREHMPDVKNINIISINKEPGSNKWRDLVTRYGAKSVPQVTMTIHGEIKYIGELSDIKKAFTPQQGDILQEKTEEACAC